MGIVEVGISLRKYLRDGRYREDLAIGGFKPFAYSLVRERRVVSLKLAKGLFAGDRDRGASPSSRHSGERQ